MLIRETGAAMSVSRVCRVFQQPNRGAGPARNLGAGHRHEQKHEGDEAREEGARAGGGRKRRHGDAIHSSRLLCSAGQSSQLGVVESFESFEDESIGLHAPRDAVDVDQSNATGRRSRRFKVWRRFDDDPDVDHALRQ